MATTLPDKAFAKANLDSPVLSGSPYQSPADSLFDPKSALSQSPMACFFEPQMPAFFPPKVGPAHINCMVTPNMPPQAVGMGIWPSVGYMQVVVVPTTANLVTTDQAGLLAASSNLTAAQLQPAAMQAEEATSCARSQASISIDGQHSQTLSKAASQGNKGTSRMWNKCDHNWKSRPQKAYQNNSSGIGVEAPKQTTLMLRNLPNDYTRDMLLQLLDEKGFKDRYNFVYLPMDFKRWVGLGYAFVNMLTFEDAVDVLERLNGFTEWKIQSSKVCEVKWGDRGQGLDAQIQRYRNSPVMHPDWSEESKPLLFENGVRVDFPPPTKKLSLPRVKKR